MKLRTKYVILKSVTIAISALSIPWGTFIGFCFGDGRYVIGIIALCVLTTVSLLDGYIWFWVLESMRNRMRESAAEEQDIPNKQVEVLRSSHSTGLHVLTRLSPDMEHN